MKTKAYMIGCSTGCTCCQEDNHVTGPFSTVEIARQQKTAYQKSGRLASQYAANGLYTIYETDAEILPDGRIILAGRYIAEGFVDDDVDDTFSLAGTDWWYGEVVKD